MKGKPNEIFFTVCVSERESERDSVITHHYSMENLIHSFDNCNYLWQAASLSHHEPQTRSSLALQFSFLLTPVILLDRYGQWQWSNVIWLADDIHTTHTAHTHCSCCGATIIAVESWPHLPRYGWWCERRGQRSYLYVHTSSIGYIRMNVFSLLYSSGVSLNNNAAIPKYNTLLN